MRWLSQVLQGQRYFRDDLDADVPKPAERAGGYVSKSRLIAIFATLALMITAVAPVIAQEAEPEVEPGTEAVAEDEAAAEAEPLPDPLSFRWGTISYNVAEGATDYIVMNGGGWLIDGQLAASGSYNHYAGTEADVCESPKALLGYGIWKTDELGGVELIGEYGAFAAGTIAINGSLKPKEIKDAQAVPARLTLNASLQSAGLITVEPEGALLQLSTGPVFATVATTSACGLDTGGGQVEFNIYEPAIKIPAPKDESKDNSGGGGGGGNSGGGGGGGGGNSGGGGGGGGGGGNSGSVDEAEQQARDKADEAEEKADQAEQQAREQMR